MKKWLFILFLITGNGFAQMLELKDASIVLINPNQLNDIVKITDTEFSKLKTITHKDLQYKVNSFSIHMIVKGEYLIYNDLTSISDEIHKIIWEGKATEINFEKVKIEGPDKKLTCNFTLKLQITH